MQRYPSSAFINASPTHSWPRMYFLTPLPSPFHVADDLARSRNLRSEFRSPWIVCGNRRISCTFLTCLCNTYANLEKCDVEVV